MAAYQPIQMPGGSGDFGSAFDRILAARQASQRAEQDRAEMLLRQQALSQQATVQGAQIKNYESEAAARAATEADRKAAIQREGQSKIIQALDSGKLDLAQQHAKSYGITIDRQAPSVTQMPGNTTMAPLNVDLTAPPAPGEENAAVFERNAKAIASNAPQAPREPTGWTIAGQAYDPAQTEAAIDAEREKTARRTEAAFDPLGYGKIAGALERGSTGGKPIETSALISQRMKAEEAARERKDLLELRQGFAADESSKYRRTFPQAMALADKAAQGRVAAAQAYGGPKQDSNTLAAFKHVDSTIHQTASELGLPKLTDTLNLFDIAKQELGKESGAAQVGARMVVERALRGGPPTQYMDQQEAAHLGGIWAQFTGKLQTIADGQMGEQQIHAIAEELDAARDQFIAARDRRLKAAEGRLLSDPSLQNMKATVSARFRQLAEGMGSESGGAMFQGEGNNLPPIGARVVEASKIPAPTVGDKLQGAAANRPGRKGARDLMMAPAAQEASDWLKANPNDPKAEAVRAKLKAMGVE